MTPEEFRKQFGRGAPVPRKKGHRPTHTPGVPNKLEKDYANHLHILELAGEITSYKFESVKLKLAHRCHYTPDFQVVLPSGRIQFHETKGHWEDDAVVKIKTAAAMYPEYDFLSIQRKHGTWIINKIPTGRKEGI